MKMYILLYLSALVLTVVAASDAKKGKVIATSYDAGDKLYKYKPGENWYKSRGLETPPEGYSYGYGYDNVPYQRHGVYPHQQPQPYPKPQPQPYPQPHHPQPHPQPQPQPQPYPQPQPHHPQPQPYPQPQPQPQPYPKPKPYNPHPQPYPQPQPHPQPQPQPYPQPHVPHPQPHPQPQPYPHPQPHQPDYNHGGHGSHGFDHGYRNHSHDYDYRSYYKLDTCEYRFILDMVQCHESTDVHVEKGHSSNHDGYENTYGNGGYGGQGGYQNSYGNHGNYGNHGTNNYGHQPNPYPDHNNYGNKNNGYNNHGSYPGHDNHVPTSPYNGPNNNGYPGHDNHVPTSPYNGPNNNGYSDFNVPNPIFTARDFKAPTSKNFTSDNASTSSDHKLDKRSPGDMYADRNYQPDPHPIPVSYPSGGYGGGFGGGFGGGYGGGYGPRNGPGYGRMAYYAPGLSNKFFSHFYSAFRAGNIHTTADKQQTRLYMRHGDYDGALADYNRMALKNVVTIDSARGATQEQVTGHLSGQSALFNYKVDLLRDGCYAQGHPGRHSCIIFSGATHPYQNVVRSFIYIKRTRRTFLETRRDRYTDGAGHETGRYSQPYNNPNPYPNPNSYPNPNPNPFPNPNPYPNHNPNPYPNPNHYPNPNPKPYPNRNPYLRNHKK